MAINKTINKSTKSHGAMRNCIEYVTRVDKTRGELVEIIGPYEPEVITYDGVYQSFLEEKRIWGKDSGRMYAHNIISFLADIRSQVRDSESQRQNREAEWCRRSAAGERKVKEAEREIAKEREESQRGSGERGRSR